MIPREKTVLSMGDTMKTSVILGAASIAALLSAGAAEAVSVTRIVPTASAVVAATVTAVVDPNLYWVVPGGVIEGVAGATDLTNNGIDYKDSWVDTNWGLVESVRVSMFNGGNEVSYVEFNAAGATKEDVFAKGNVTGSTWTDIAATSFNYFSTRGDNSIDRHWFMNQNYGGCSIDVGHMVVLDGARAGSPCFWEASRIGTGSGTRGFLYADATTKTNWTTGSGGLAEVFAVSVTYDDGLSPVPLPASILLLGSAVGSLGDALDVGVATEPS